MAVQEGLRRLPRIGLDEPDVGMGQDQAEEGNLLPPAPDLHHRLAEVDLRHGPAGDCSGTKASRVDCRRART